MTLVRSNLTGEWITCAQYSKEESDESARIVAMVDQSREMANNNPEPEKEWF